MTTMLYVSIIYFRKEFQKKLKGVDSLKVPFQIMLGEIDLDTELQLAVIDENYEEAAIIRDTININNILKNLFI